MVILLYGFFQVRLVIPDTFAFGERPPQSHHVQFPTYRPPAPDIIIQMEDRPIMHLHSNWTTQVGLISKLSVGVQLFDVVTGQEVGYGVARWGKFMSTAVCLLHHHIGSESEFECGLNIASDRDVYEAQINWMARHYDFIDLDTLLSGRLPRRPMLLTFDDAFRSSLEVVRTVLAPRGIPSIYFINPGLLGSDAISLDSTLAWAASKVGLERLCDSIGILRRASVGEVIAEEMAAYGADERAEIKAKTLATFGPPDFTGRAPLLDEDDLKEFTDLGVEIGNHTMTHVHCRALKKREIEDEVVNAKVRLETLSGARVRSFSVPYGNERDLTPEMIEALRESGHEAIFLVHARSNRRRPAPDVWYRTSLHNEAPKELAKNLCYLPIVRSIKKLLLG